MWSWLTCSASQTRTRFDSLASYASSYVSQETDWPDDLAKDSQAEVLEDHSVELDTTLPGDALDAGSLCLGSLQFDLRVPEVRSKLLAAIGARPDASLQEYRGGYADEMSNVWLLAGCMNQGIWFMKDGRDDMVLKLVKFDASKPVELRETAVYQRLYREIPEITNDSSVSFPTKILQIVGAGNVRQYDLYVMRRVTGRTLESIIESYWKKNRQAELMEIFRRVGECLGKFHRRYGGRQHCDAGPQNIFYDELSQEVALIDLGMMGACLAKTDIEMFSDYVRQRWSSHTAEMLNGLYHFWQGYNRVAPVRAMRGGA